MNVQEINVAARKSWESREGSPHPLGVTHIAEEDAFNFAIYSKHANQVTLLVYAEGDYVNPVLVYNFDYLVNKSNRIWHCRIPSAALGNGKYYAYKIDGPEPVSQIEWHAFEVNKILLDPYARVVFFPPAFNRLTACYPGANDGKAPLGMIGPLSDRFNWADDRFEKHENNLVIYELHVKGFTFEPDSGVSAGKRGTFAGVIEKIPYLKELGVTAIELMPVHQFDPQNGDYWGYSTLNFFTPHHEYCSNRFTWQQADEFREMVKALHKAGMEVILDVVYNHTTEGNHNGPVYSYKGIDNSTYYLINEDLGDPYFNYSGTGNTLHTRNSHVRQMILDSLRFWRKEMHVDGFRFDLASVFSRNPDGTISFEEAPIFSAISSDPDLADARFIAEPWDATGISQLGKNFPGVRWLQWNNLFRDDVRRFVRGDDQLTGKLMMRLYGSNDLFSDELPEAYHAYQSVNYINSHDGFTLYDLVSYNQKHNAANGHNNLDGAENEFSWNCGHEGVENISDEIFSLRKKQARNFCTLLLLANGTPMFTAGDEFLRTQKGNNNPYNQDNDTSWIDWRLLEKNQDFFEFFKKMIAFRKAHPSLSRSRFWREDIKWYGTEGETDLNSHSLAYCLKGHSQNDDDIYVMINMEPAEKVFLFQEKGNWQRIVHTGLETPGNFLEPGMEIIPDEEYSVPPHSICVFVDISPEQEGLF